MRYTNEQIKSTIKQKGYKYYTKPWQLNIISVRYNTAEVNTFNDFLYVSYVDNTGKEFFLEFSITTDPGNYWLSNPSNANGTAILVPGQYINSHEIGSHQGRYDALRQKRRLSVYRDGNRDLILDLDPDTIDIGIFGINIHRSSSSSNSHFINKWSAGCQVFSRNDDFERFMRIVKTSRRFNGNNFTYTLLERNDILDEGNDFDDEIYDNINRPNNNNSQNNFNSRPEPELPDGKDINRYEEGKSKDINVIQEKTLKLQDLKVQVNAESNTLEAQFIGSLIPYISYNSYVFNYKQIDFFKLYYDDRFPRLIFSIDDVRSEFNSLFLPKDSDIITLYLKSNSPEYKSIYLEFDLNDMTKSQNYYTFDCIIKITDLFNEKCKSYDNMSSFDMFKEVATDLELGYNSNITSTNDIMTWIQGYDSYLNFLNREINYTYLDEKSFMDYFIDFYYHLNYIDLNNQFGDYKKQESIITLVNTHIKSEYSDEEPEINSSLIFTNSSLYRGTNNYIYEYDLENNSGDIKFRNGYDRKIIFYDSELKQKEDHEVKPNYETDKDDRYRSNGEGITKYKWEGYQLTNEETRNVHNNHLYAKVYRHQNMEEINKMKLLVKLDKANFHIYRYQSIPIALYEYNKENQDLIGLKNDIVMETGKPTGVLLEQYSGHYVVENIEYTYDKNDRYIRQNLDLIRREWNKNKII